MQQVYEDLGWEPLFNQPQLPMFSTKETRFGWGGPGSKYYHLVKPRKYLNKKEVVYLDCNSWQRKPRFIRPPIDSGLQPCPKCFKKLAVGDLLRQG